MGCWTQISKLGFIGLVGLSVITVFYYRLLVLGFLYFISNICKL